MAKSTVARDLAALLPEAPDEMDPCVQRLTRTITATAGVQGAHLLVGAPADPVRFCVHYDPVRATRQDLQEVLGRSAAELTARYGHLSHRVADGEDIVDYTVAVRTRLQRFSEFVTVTGDGLRTVHIEFDRHAVTLEDLTTTMATESVRTTRRHPDPDPDPDPGHDVDHRRVEPDHHDDRDPGDLPPRSHRSAAPIPVISARTCSARSQPGPLQSATSGQNGRKGLVMVGGEPGKRARSPRGVAVNGRSTPWATIAGVVVVVLFAAVVFGYALLRGQANAARDAAVSGFVPSADDQDPSARIPGVTERTYQGGQHVTPAEQVAYTQSPPLGGTHDQFWAACNGVVYPQPVRSENLVHSMEHGAAWIAYNPDQITGDALAALTRRVAGKPYTVLSPYPGLAQPVTVQSWGHQLALADTADPRIDQFLAALRANPYTHPENGASCDALGPGQFDQDQPPPFRPAPPATALGQPGVRSDTEAAPSGSGAGAGSTGGGGS